MLNKFVKNMKFFEIFKLQQIMRLGQSTDPIVNRQIQQYSLWLLDVGDGKLGQDVYGVSDIEIPNDILLVDTNDPLASIVAATYNNFLSSMHLHSYFMYRAILALIIQVVTDIYEYMCALLPGEEFEFLSCYTICMSTNDLDTDENLYSTEFFNTISCSGLPRHNCSLKLVLSYSY